MPKANKNKMVSEAMIAYNPEPEIELDDSVLPAIKDWNVGDTYDLNVKGKLVKLEERERYDEKGKTKTCARFKIIKAE